MTHWLKDCLLSCLKRNYYLKKSGVRLTLEQKHEWDRTMKPIERSMGRILLTHPYLPPIVKVEGAQAMLLQLTEKKDTEEKEKDKIKNKDKDKGIKSNEQKKPTTYHSQSINENNNSRPNSPMSSEYLASSTVINTADSQPTTTNTATPETESNPHTKSELAEGTS